MLAFVTEEEKNFARKGGEWVVIMRERQLTGNKAPPKESSQSNFNFQFKSCNLILSANVIENWKGNGEM